MKKKSPYPHGSTDEFCQSLKEELSPILHSLLQGRKYFPTYFVRPALPRRRQYKKRKLWTNILHEHRCRNPQPRISKSRPSVYLYLSICLSNTSWPSRVLSRENKAIQYLKTNQCISVTHQVWKLWKKNQTTWLY